MPPSKSGKRKKSARTEQVAVVKKIGLCEICWEHAVLQKIDSCGCETACMMCLQVWLRTSITEHHGVVPIIKCPVSSCTSKLTAEEIVKFATSRDGAKYESLVLRPVLENMNFVPCPRQGCSSGGIPPSQPCGKATIGCPECSYDWPYHERSRSLKETAMDWMNLKYILAFIMSFWSCISTWLVISVSTQPCPQCLTPIRKNGACPHINCRMCGFEFCWLCHANYYSHVCVLAQLKYIIFSIAFALVVCSSPVVSEMSMSVANILGASLICYSAYTLLNRTLIGQSESEQFSAVPLFGIALVAIGTAVGASYLALLFPSFFSVALDIVTRFVLLPLLSMGLFGLGLAAIFGYIGAWTGAVIGLSVFYYFFESLSNFTFSSLNFAASISFLGAFYLAPLPGLVLGLFSAMKSNCLLLKNAFHLMLIGVASSIFVAEPLLLFANRYFHPGFVDWIAHILQSHAAIAQMILHFSSSILILLDFAPLGQFSSLALYCLFFACLLRTATFLLFSSRHYKLYLLPFAALSSFSLYSSFVSPVLSL